MPPIYEQIAKRLKYSEHLVLAEIDLTSNEVENLRIDGFPSLKFYPGGEENIIDYKIERSEESLVLFIKQNARFPIIDLDSTEEDFLEEL